MSAVGVSVSRYLGVGASVSAAAPELPTAACGRSSGPPVCTLAHFLSLSRQEPPPRHRGWVGTTLSTEGVWVRVFFFPKDAPPTALHDTSAALFTFISWFVMRVTSRRRGETYSYCFFPRLILQICTAPSQKSWCFFLVLLCRFILPPPPNGVFFSSYSADLYHPKTPTTHEMDFVSNKQYAI